MTACSISLQNVFEGLGDISGPTVQAASVGHPLHPTHYPWENSNMSQEARQCKVFHQGNILLAQPSEKKLCLDILTPQVHP